jgi:hypothetical protein
MSAAKLPTALTLSLEQQDMQKHTEVNSHFFFALGLNSESETVLVEWLEEYFKAGFWLPYCWLLPFALIDIGVKPFPRIIRASLMVHERKWFKDELQQIPRLKQYGSAIARQLSTVLSTSATQSKASSLAKRAVRDVTQDLITWLTSEDISLRREGVVLSMEGHLRDRIKNSGGLQSIIGSWAFSSGRGEAFEDFIPVTWNYLEQTEVDPQSPDGPGSKINGQQRIISRSETGSFLERSAGSMPAQLGRWSPMDLLFLKEVPDYFSYKVASCEINQTWGSRLASSRMKSSTLLDFHIELGELDFVVADNANPPASDLCRVLVLGLLRHAAWYVREGVWDLSIRMRCQTPLGFDDFFIEAGHVESLARSSDRLRLFKDIRHRMPALFEVKPGKKNPRAQPQASRTDLLLSLGITGSALNPDSLQSGSNELPTAFTAMRRMETTLDRDQGVAWSVRTRGTVGLAGGRSGCLAPDCFARDLSFLADDLFGSVKTNPSARLAKSMSQAIEVQL